jgi:hypothetical protein
MTDLLRFLLARLTDEEYHVHHPAQDISHDRALTASGWWSPARVVAECEAKRRILLMAEQPPRWPGPAAPPDPDTVQAVLRYLALPYADHPDYRPEWRP